MKRFLPTLCFSFALQAFGFTCLQFGVEPFRHYYYVTSWWSYIILADTIFAFRRGRFLLLNRRLPLFVVISSGYWCLFELLNLRLQNWHYIGLPAELPLRYAGYILSFGTVIPAILITNEVFTMFLHEGDCRATGGRDGNPGRWYPSIAIMLGVASLAAVVLFPRFAFPLTWAFLALILDGWCYMRDYPSFMKEIERGTWRSLLAASASGLICGILWEAWNFRAAAKWIYSVPFLQGMKLFEMPLPGYAGFPAFGIETMAFVGLLKGMEARKSILYVVAALCLALSFAAFPLIDRYTALSCDVLYR